MSASASMTQREFNQFVIGLIDGTEGIDVMSVREFALANISKLDHRNELRKANPKPSKESIEAQARREAVKAVIAENPTVIYDRAKLAELTGLTVGQITAAMTVLVREGVAVKYPAKGKVPTQYKLA